MRGAKCCVLLLAIVVAAIAVLVGVIFAQIRHSPRRFLRSSDPDVALTGAERRARCIQVRESQNPRALYNVEFDPVEFAGPAGTLRGWFVPAVVRPSSGSVNTTIVFAPGAGSHIVLEPLRALPALRRFANVLAFDTASCGASDGDGGVGFGNREWRDVLAAVDFVLDRDPSSRIVLAGHSAGAAASLHAAREIVLENLNVSDSRLHRRRVSGVISSASFASLEAEASRHIFSGFLRRNLPDRWRAVADVLIGERIARFLAAAVHVLPLSHGEWLREPIDSVRILATAATRPLRLLIIHGGHDPVVHVDNAATLAAAAADRDSWVNVSQCIVPRMSHSFIELWSQLESTCIGGELERFFAALED